MKSYKKCAAVAAAAAMLSLGVFTACAHVHVYSDWGHNATGHWKECPEDKETDKSSYAAPTES